MSDIEAIATKVIEKIPEIVEKKPELAFRIFEMLKRYFVPIELLQDYLKNIDKKIDRIEKKVDRIEKDVAEIRGETKTLRDDVEALRGDVEVLKSDVGALRGDMEALRGDVEVLKRDTYSLKKSLDRLMLSLEEEAKDHVEWLLNKHGIKMKIEPKVICGMEFDLFGIEEDLILVGDATVRAGPKVIEWMYNRAQKLAKCSPDYKKKKFIIVIYSMHFTPSAIEKAKKIGIWLISANKEVTELKTIKL